MKHTREPMESKMKRIERFMIATWIAGILLSLSITVGVGWVIYALLKHFGVIS
jgi:hypothetical protein